MNYADLDIQRLRQDLKFDGQLGAHTLSFRSTWGLFSPKGIDEGTQMLVQYMDGIEPHHHSLDLGCGYGPIGLYLAKMAPQGQCTLVDKDFTAIEYAKKNAELNGIKNVDIHLSNGFNQVDPQKRFDLVASNLPAKTGKELFYLAFHDAHERMNPGGRFYVVSITGLRRFVEKGFKEVFGHYKKVKQGKTYTVAYAEKQS